MTCNTDGVSFERTYKKEIKMIDGKITDEKMAKWLSGGSFDDPTTQGLGMETKYFEKNFFLLKDSNGEIYELQITGNIDPGAWEDL